MEAQHTFIPVRMLLVGSLLAAGGLGNAVSIETDTPPFESSGARSLESTGLYLSTPVTESPAVGGVEAIDSRYLRHGQVGLVDVHAESDDLFADVVWALSRFRESGMPLPEVEVFASADQTECGSSAAYLTFVGEEQDMRIRACGTRTTLLHELGHAWDIATLSDGRRNAFMELRGLESWSAETWSEAAGEHAATVVAWGLNERAHGQNLMPNDVSSMRDGFVLLTGGRPLWEPPADVSDHGPALDHRNFIGETDPDQDVQVVDATPQAEEQQTPEFAARLRQDLAAVQKLTKPALRAVAGANGRIGFLVKEAADSFNAMKLAAGSDDVELSFVSAWRSWKVQERAHQHFLATGTNLAGNSVPNVAHPDASNHPRGLALDFALEGGVHEWLEAKAPRFGWYPISSEAWHWEYRGVSEALLRRMSPVAPPPLPVDDMLAALNSRIA
jgi:LAS superfamily LD-carboxypeptidase LdcB